MDDYARFVIDVLDRNGVEQAAAKRLECGSGVDRDRRLVTNSSLEAS
jgi:hypothetical protein